MKTLLLIRGLPGSGKTSLANLIKDVHWDVTHREADQWMQQEGVYKFDPIRLAEVHQECQQAVKADMIEGTNLIIVSNTFTTNREIAPYRLLAAQYQYRLCVITVEHGMLPPTALAERNAHNVPAETIQRMADRWEQFRL